MTSKEALEYLLKQINSDDNKAKRCKRVIEKDLKMLEILKHPRDEEETENEAIINNAWWNEYLGELVYGVTYYEWDGTYRETYNKILDTTFKEKNFVERFHSGNCHKPLKIKDVKELLQVLVNYENETDKRD